MGIYFLHFLVGCVGVFTFGILLALLVHTVFSEAVSNAIFGGPVFLGQIGLGFLAGFALNRKLRSKSAMWVWVPSLIWMLALMTDDIRSPELGGVLHTIWLDMFSRNPGDLGLGGVIGTSVFYSSVAYSIAAWLARKSATAPSRVE